MTDIEKDTALEGTLVDPIAAARSKERWIDLQNLDIPGWSEVIVKEGGGGYDWDFFGAWYDAADRIFYWHTDSGCSCNAPGDGIYTTGDLEQGRKHELIAAYKDWCAGEYTDIPHAEKVSAGMDIRAAIRKAVRS